MKHEPIALNKRRRPETPEQQRGRELAVRRAAELRRLGELDERHGAVLVASLGDGGFMSWRSSPHVMWLAAVLNGESF